MGSIGSVVEGAAKGNSVTSVEEAGAEAELVGEPQVDGEGADSPSRKAGARASTVT